MGWDGMGWDGMGWDGIETNLKPAGGPLVVEFFSAVASLISSCEGSFTFRKFERIKIAKENYKSVGNLHFYVGDSVTGFPYDNDSYYDVYISTNAFNWLPEVEQSIFVQKAFECLKSGGRLGIWCAARLPDDMKIPNFYSLTEQGFRNLFQKLALFENVVVEESPYAFQFKSFTGVQRWFRASTHVDLDDLDATTVERFVTREENGDFMFRAMNTSIKAFKP